MARSKPYTFWLGFWDVVLTLCTSGLYLLIILVRELYRRK